MEIKLLKAQLNYKENIKKIVRKKVFVTEKKISKREVDFTLQISYKENKFKKKINLQKKSIKVTIIRKKLNKYNLLYVQQHVLDFKRWCATT